MHFSGIGVCAALALWCLACSRPPAGVLTLAPAGMRTSGACVANHDGTLDAPAGATAEAVAYMDAAPATITITARTLGGAAGAMLEVWVAGNKLGTATVTSDQNAAFPFRVQPTADGPQAIRLVLTPKPDPAATTTTVLHLEKVVITQP